MLTFVLHKQIIYNELIIHNLFPLLQNGFYKTLIAKLRIYKRKDVINTIKLLCPVPCTFRYCSACFYYIFINIQASFVEEIVPVYFNFIGPFYLPE